MIIYILELVVLIFFFDVVLHVLKKQYFAAALDMGLTMWAFADLLEHFGVH